MSQNVEKTVTLTENELLLLAGHVEMVMRITVTPRFRRDAPMVLGFSIREHVVRVELWNRGAGYEAWGPVWDQGTVDGQAAGNRCGVAQALAKRFFEMMKSP